MVMMRRDFVTALAGSMGALSAGASLPAAPASRNFQFDPKRQYQMPGHFGPRLPGKGSARYLDVTMIAVTYLTDPGKLIQYLPEPFEVGREPRITGRIGPDGQLRLQQDRTPVATFRPTTSWQPGEMLRDNYGFVLTPDLPLGRYQIWVAMYTWPSQERLLATTAEGEELGDFLVAATFELVDSDASLD